MSEYQGLFLRHYEGQVPGENGTGWSESPDIIPYGTTFADDPNVFATNYNQDYGSEVYFEVENWVYMRGKNTAPGSHSATISFFYTESDLALWPKNWRSDNITYKGIAQNWATVTANTTGEVVVTNPGFEWKPPAFPPGHSQGDHYCLVAYADNTAQQKSFDPTTFGSVLTFDDLGNIIKSHPNMAWRNTVDVPTDLPTWQRVVNITGPTQTSQYKVGLQFTNMPTDGYFDFQVPGPDSHNYIKYPKTKINKSSQTIAVTVTYPGGFDTSITFSYYQGATPPPVGALITPVAFVPDPDNPFGNEIVTIYNNVINPFRRSNVVFAYDSPALVSITPTPVITIGAVPHRFTATAKK